MRPADAPRRCDELMKIDDAGGRGSSGGGDRGNLNDEGIDVSNIMPEGSRRCVSGHSYVEDDANGNDQDGRKHDDCY